jgi:hypothetical protein
MPKERCLRKARSIQVLARSLQVAVGDTRHLPRFGQAGGMFKKVSDEGNKVQGDLCRQCGEHAIDEAAVESSFEEVPERVELIVHVANSHAMNSDLCQAKHIARCLTTEVTVATSATEENAPRYRAHESASSAPEMKGSKMRARDADPWVNAWASSQLPTVAPLPPSDSAARFTRARAQGSGRRESTSGMDPFRLGFGASGLRWSGWTP